VLLGHYEDDPVINPDEVSSWKWMALEEVKNDIDQNPDRYTVWFVIIFTKFYKDLIPDLWL
jgi:isopentenyl-diphosphate delta-isomerase